MGNFKSSMGATEFINRNFIFFLLCICFLVKTTSLNAQVLNVDRENGQDSTKKKFLMSFSGLFSSDKQKKKFIELSNSVELDCFLKSNYFFVLLNRTDIAYNGTSTIESNGFVQLRFRDNDTRLVAPDVYTQFQWNGIVGLENRTLVGINARINCLEKKKSDLYISVGSFYEMERWNTSLSSYAYKTNVSSLIYREMFRLNTVFKFAFKITKKIDFTGVSYCQFPLNKHFTNPRWVFDSNIYFEISKHLNFLIHYDHSIDGYRPLPIDVYYYSLNFGVQARI